MIMIRVWIENSNADIALINLSNKQGILIAFLLKHIGLVQWEVYVNTRVMLSLKRWTTWHDILAFSVESDPTSVFAVVYVVRDFFFIHVCNLASFITKIPFRHYIRHANSNYLNHFEMYISECAIIIWFLIGDSLSIIFYWSNGVQLQWRLILSDNIFKAGPKVHIIRIVRRTFSWEKIKLLKFYEM